MSTRKSLFAFLSKHNRHFTSVSAVVGDVHMPPFWLCRVRRGTGTTTTVTTFHTGVMKDGVVSLGLVRLLLVHTMYGRADTVNVNA